MTDDDKKKKMALHAKNMITRAHARGHYNLSAWYDARLFRGGHATRPAFDCDNCGSTFVLCDLDGTTIESPGFGDCHETQMGAWPRHTAG